MERWKCPDCKGWVGEHVDTHYCYTHPTENRFFYPNHDYPHYVKQYYSPISPYHVYSNYMAKISSYQKDSTTSD